MRTPLSIKIKCLHEDVIRICHGAYWNRNRGCLHPGWDDVIENDGSYYTIEVLPPKGVFQLQQIAQHTHTITKVTPDEKRPNALVYFTLDAASAFGSNGVFDKFAMHSHNCRWLDCCKPRIYYVGDDRQIYDYSTDRSFANTPPYMLHDHRIVLLDVRSASAVPKANKPGDVQATPKACKRRTAKRTPK